MSKTALIFPGQGAFYAGALQETRLVYPTVKRLLDVIEAVALRRFGRSLIKVMWDEKSNTEYLLKADPAILQLAIYAVSVAAYEILQAEGVEPDVLVGHSFGEIGALTCANVYTIEQGAEIVCDRVESLEVAASRDGCMAAISASPEQVRAILNTFAASRPAVSTASMLTIAVENHNAQTVVSGSSSEANAFITYCGEHKFSAQRLHSPYAFHHPALKLASSTFASRLAVYPASRPKRQVYSPILGRYYQDGDAVGDLLAQHLVQPVRFGAAVQFLHAEGVNVCIECGALNALSKIVIRVLGPGNVKVFPALEQKANELNNIRKITHHLNQESTMNAPISTEVIFPEFEAFWKERSPILMAQIKSEFIRFVEAEQARRKPDVAQPAASIAPALQIVSATKPAAMASVIPRTQLFDELVGIYAEAMEYPAEVFSEVVELEAELGIDSVKQTEIIGRISTQYGLPPLPANFRSGEFKTMGQIVDFVFVHQGQAVIAT